ncbi:hypothetical protein FGO68_gene8997 [Halteria grandinella]|uniref:Uncharacterized protein n=1 Tax=Halteria grandinella TaxID=5974 RepID=A0A8J8SZ87_HALGN|nr:hypothetical protein FGO68_gene8997 [Halteria grandinella]
MEESYSLRSLLFDPQEEHPLLAQPVILDFYTFKNALISLGVFAALTTFTEVLRSFNTFDFKQAGAKIDKYLLTYHITGLISAQVFVDIAVLFFGLFFVLNPGNFSDRFNDFIDQTYITPLYAVIIYAVMYIPVYSLRLVIQPFKVLRSFFGKFVSSHLLIVVATIISAINLYGVNIFMDIWSYQSLLVANNPSNPMSTFSIPNTIFAIGPFLVKFATWMTVFGGYSLIDQAASYFFFVEPTYMLFRDYIDQTILTE